MKDKIYEINFGDDVRKTWVLNTMGISALSECGIIRLRPGVHELCIERENFGEKFFLTKVDDDGKVFEFEWLNIRCRRIDQKSYEFNFGHYATTIVAESAEGIIAVSDFYGLISLSSGRHQLRIIKEESEEKILIDVDDFGNIAMLNLLEVSSCLITE